MPKASSLLFLLFVALQAHAADNSPRGFFLADLSTPGAVPAFYNLDAKRLQPFPFKEKYSQFIDVDWDRERGRVLFSAKRAPGEPFRVFIKSWPSGEEKVIYENPLGALRFLRSPDGQRLALQLMGPSAWPTIAVLDIESGKVTALGTGYSPDWSKDSRRLLFLRIPGSLPSFLMEYRVDLTTATQLLPGPVMEAAYSDDPEQIILKTAERAPKCDMFQVWRRRTNTYVDFCRPLYWKPKQLCPSQREVAVFPGHQSFSFKESPGLPDQATQTLVVCDGFGGRLQTLEHDDWFPSAVAVEEATLVVGEDPLSVLPVDGAGGRKELPKTGFIRARR